MLSTVGLPETVALIVWMSSEWPPGASAPLASSKERALSMSVYTTSTSSVPG